MYSLKRLWKYLFKCFLWFFKIWWVQENQGVRVPSGTTQGNSYPIDGDTSFCPITNIDVWVEGLWVIGFWTFWLSTSRKTPIKRQVQQK
jgi:hypothetical protein